MYRIIRLEAFLAGMILTVSAAYAATICPLVWTKMRLESETKNHSSLSDGVDR